MTDAEIQAYYSGLLIKQFAGQPNAVAHIQALAGSLVLGQVFTAVQNAYSFPGAVGVQLDVIGQYIGVSRNGYTFSGPITLDDGDYTTALLLCAIRNSSDATLYELAKSIEKFFPGTLRLYDYLNMTMSYFVDPGTFSTDLAEFCVIAGIFPKPAGVRLAAPVLSPINTNYYGFVTYSNPNPFTQSPYGLYSDYQTDHPWLSYYDAVWSGSPDAQSILTEGDEIIDTESGEGISTE